MYHEHELVDEILLHQRSNELSAAHDQNVFSRLSFQSRHSVGGVAFEQGRVPPRKRFGQRRRDDVILGVVESLPVRIVFPIRPDIEEIRVGSSTEQ